MGYQTLGYNINNLTFDFTINASQKVAQFTTQAPAVVDTISGGKFSYILAFIYFTVYYLSFSDKTPFTDFGYSDIRSLVLALGFTLLVIIELFDTGFILSLRVIPILFVLFLASTIIVLLIEGSD